MVVGRGDHFRFGSVFIKKNNQTEIFFLKKKPNPNRNRVKPTSFGSVRFGFLEQKPVQTGLARFSRFWLGFFQFLLGFFRFGSVLARFGSIFFPVFCRFRFGSVRFFVYKTGTEPTGFFIKLIGFFFGSVSSITFFLVFSV
jgi:hypothetical protein